MQQFFRITTIYNIYIQQRLYTVSMYSISMQRTTPTTNMYSGSLGISLTFHSTLLSLSLPCHSSLFRFTVILRFSYNRMNKPMIHCCMHINQTTVQQYQKVNFNMLCTFLQTRKLMMMEFSHQAGTALLREHAEEGAQSQPAASFTELLTMHQL